LSQHATTLRTPAASRTSHSITNCGPQIGHHHWPLHSRHFDDPHFMAAVPNASVSTTYELRGATLSLLALLLKTTDLAELAAQLDAQALDAPGLFDQDPVAIDLSQVREATEAIDFAALNDLLRRHKLQPIAVRRGSAQQMAAALDAGLVEAQESAAPVRMRDEAQEAPLEPAAEDVAVAEAPAAAAPALIVDRPLRSGQQVYARGGDLVVLAVVSYGAEVIADGSIHVYAPLRGRAVAGARGDTRARIFTTCMEPQLISIAGTYRTTETALPADVLGKPAQARLEGERLVVEALKF